MDDTRCYQDVSQALNDEYVNKELQHFLSNLRIDKDKSVDVKCSTIRIMSHDGPKSYNTYTTYCHHDEAEDGSYFPVDPAYVCYHQGKFVSISRIQRVQSFVNVNEKNN